MKFTEVAKDDVVIFELDGELMGGEETQPFQNRIYEMIREGKINAVVNMARVKWMNSSGLGTLMAGLTTLRGSGGDLKLAEVPDRVRRPIEITKLDQVLKMYDSESDAISSFREED